MKAKIQPHLQEPSGSFSTVGRTQGLEVFSQRILPAIERWLQLS